MQFKAVLLRQLGDKPFVGVGFRSAQLVIDVGNREHDPEFCAQIQKQQQQGHGIRAARHGRSEAVARLDQVLLADCFQQPLG
jgi:hypothetical protein